MGGSFNPVHMGHLIMAQEIRSQFHYDLVLFVPSFRPPHKDLSTDPGPQHRIAMLRAAIGDDRRLAVDDCEIRRGGTSYTIDTLRDVVERYEQECKPGFILGDDLMPGFASWRDPDILAREADIICAHRSTTERLPFSWPHRYADNMLVQISSSLVRERAAVGEDFRFLVPDSIFDYVRRNKLYGFH
jgi:nicotinate-nucleotide adenylyltransferase